MSVIKEPLNVDISIKSQPWPEKDLADFRIIMQKIKDKNARTKETVAKRRNKLSTKKQTKVDKI